MNEKNADALKAWLRENLIARIETTRGDYSSNPRVMISLSFVGDPIPFTTAESGLPHPTHFDRRD